MLAFAHALDVGVTHIETDVHATADGVAVIVHDPALDRVAGRDMQVGATRLADLRSIDLGGGQQVPELREALLAFPDTKFNIDLKSDAAVVPTVRAIVEAKAEQRVLVTSFHERRRAHAVRLLPGVATSASRSIMLRAVAAERARSATALERALRGVDAIQVPRRVGKVPIISPRSVAAYTKAGVEVHVWTINDPAEMRELLDMGVHGIVTDRADLAVPLIR